MIIWVKAAAPDLRLYIESFCSKDETDITNKVWKDHFVIDEEKADPKERTPLTDLHGSIKHAMRSWNPKGKPTIEDTAQKCIETLKKVVDNQKTTEEAINKVAQQIWSITSIEDTEKVPNVLRKFCQVIAVILQKLTLHYQRPMRFGIHHCRTCGRELSIISSKEDLKSKVTPRCHHHPFRRPIML